MVKGINLRNIESRDAVLLAELYDRVWPENAGMHFAKTKWAIETCEIRGVCAEFNGKIVGSRSCFHTNIFIGKDKVSCLQFGDSCVDERFRGKGLFSRMNNRFLEMYYRTGDEMIYNISVEASKKAYEKLGWKYIDTLMKLYYIGNVFSFVWKTKGNIKKLAGIMEVEPSPIPDTSVIPNDLLDLRESQLSQNHIIHTKYDCQTLKWRMGTDSSIRLFYDAEIGACLYKIGIKNGLRFCVIGDIFLRKYDLPSFKALFRKLKTIVKADVYETSICYSHPLYKLYKSSGFLKNPLRTFLNLGVRVVSQNMKEICYRPDNWALTNLDLDTF